MSDAIDPKSRREGPGRSFWIATAVGVVAIGALARFVLRPADNLAQNNVQRSRQNLQTTTAEISSTLNLAIQHEQDLAISAGAFIVENPQRLPRVAVHPLGQ